MSYRCPNCESAMSDPDDPCPECDHNGGDDWCECAFCEECRQRQEYHEDQQAREETENGER